jgi:HPt (histidine-containing phosphotransfer) domain-containing protein
MGATFDNGESVALSALQELRDLASSSGDPGQFGELIQLFLQEMDLGLLSMRQALKERDGKKLAELAHSLKGSSASMGARNVAALCRAVEEAAKGAELSGIETQLALIQFEAKVVRAVLEKEISDGLSTSEV